jgi:hypothetical protein
MSMKRRQFLIQTAPLSRRCTAPGSISSGSSRPISPAVRGMWRETANRFLNAYWPFERRCAQVVQGFDFVVSSPVEFLFYAVSA